MLPHQGSSSAGGDEPLRLPPAWSPPHRPALPLLASIVPVLGAVALWLVTGSVLSLWLALLGPLIAVATMVDAARGARRERRRARREADTARERIAEIVAQRQREERSRLWAKHPDAAALAARDDEVWRAVPGRGDVLVVGAGVRASSVRVSGGDGDEAAMALRARAATLDGAPVAVPIRAGVAVVGPAVLATAVVRGFVLQLCAVLPPGRLRIIGALREENAWVEALPHRRASEGLAMAILGPDDTAPPGADIVIAHARPPAPASCDAVLTVSAPDHAELDYAGEIVRVDIEALGASQGARFADDLARRALAVLGAAPAEAGTVMLEPLLSRADRRPGGLAAVIGSEGGRPVVVDLVEDGPHAVVAGVTGSGKSELLITWIVSLCATRSTSEVSFLLADFKGGTAFDGLSGVPHVTGVLTDLNGAGARRAIESLRAEVRWREGELARVGARDVRDERAQLARLVIVVDEFAALLGAHPELHAVFTDVAARGRALGMHLILGTQRVAGVVREALLTNCPLRLSLRVIDEADSRAVVGTPHAARLPGGPHGRGTALVRRGGDAAPQTVRIALSTPADVEAVRARDAGAAPRRPWLPELPPIVPLEQLRETAGAGSGIVLGLVDEPEQQRQRPAVLEVRERGLLIVGAAGTGRSTVLRTIAAQADGEVIRVPASAEGAWDEVALLEEQPPPPGSVVLIDDLDALATRLPHDYAHVLLERIEHVVRAAGDRGLLIVATMQRPVGGAARVADLLPRRAMLTMASRTEYVGAGGDPAHFSPDAPPGRGRLDGWAIQFAQVGADATAAPGSIAAPDPSGMPGSFDGRVWVPSAPLTGFVARRSATVRTVVEAWRAGGARIVQLEDIPRGADLGELDGLTSPTDPRGARVVVVGDPEEWQRQWSVLARIRGDHDLLIDAACAPEYRVVAGDRTLPPYCEPGRQRGWLRREDAPAVRVALVAGRPDRDVFTRAKLDR